MQVSPNSNLLTLFNHLAAIDNIRFPTFCINFVYANWTQDELKYLRKSCEAVVDTPKTDDFWQTVEKIYDQIPQWNLWFMLNMLKNDGLANDVGEVFLYVRLLCCDVQPYASQSKLKSLNVI